ncbi:hypothetical protein U1Q18_027103 [Sarracenia purpurea var. burkii]
MQPPHQHDRINLAELKTQIVKKLGQQGSKQYFYYLNRFLSLKLSKVDFNKLCLRIFGKENVPLHNLFIHLILKNACSAKSPPTHDKEVLKLVRAVGNNEPPRDGQKQSLLNPQILSNGDIWPLSTHKVWRESREQKILDHPNASEPNGKTNFVYHPPSAEHESSISSVVLQNGDLTQHDVRRLVQHHQGLRVQAKENDGEVSRYHSANLSAVKSSPDGSVSLLSKDPVPVFIKDGKEVSARCLLRAPLGVPSFPVSVGLSRRMMPLVSSSNCANSFNSGGLLDTTALRQRMEQIAATQGLKVVTMDSANLLNNGLDAYLKSLIMSSIELVEARSGHEPRKNGINKHQAHLKLVRPGHHYHMQSRTKPIERIQERKLNYPISLLDFRVAMEVNPQQLGEDWPLLLEKICTHSFEE